MALYIFLDEAGNLSNNHDRHGVLAAFVTEQPKVTRKYFVRAKQTKLPGSINTTPRSSSAIG